MTTEEVKTMEIEEVVTDHVIQLVDNLIHEVTSHHHRRFTEYVREDLKGKGIKVEFKTTSCLMMSDQDGRELVEKLVRYTMGRIVE